MKLSIIVPVYKAEHYIEDTILSILNQKYSDFELILVDDGSPDDSGFICDRYAQSNDRVKVIHKENGGVSSARNAGIANARGEYIGFVDSDDIISPVMYEQMMILANSHNADIVQCMHTRNPDELDYSTVPINIQIYNNVNALKQIYQQNYTNCLALWSKVYRRSLFENIKFPEGRVFEDDEIVPHLFAKSHKVVMVDNNWYCYIKRENSIITAPSMDSLSALTETLQNRMTFFKAIDDELYHLSVNHFRHYLMIKYVSCYTGGEGLKIENAGYFRDYIILNLKYFLIDTNIYNRIYFILLGINIERINRWIGTNDFAPIQCILAKIKGYKQYRRKGEK